MDLMSPPHRAAPGCFFTFKRTSGCIGVLGLVSISDVDASVRISPRSTQLHTALPKTVIVAVSLVRSSFIAAAGCPRSPGIVNVAST